jgi:hypothetical protein
MALDADSDPKALSTGLPGRNTRSVRGSSQALDSPDRKSLDPNGPPPSGSPKLISTTPPSRKTGGDEASSLSLNGIQHSVSVSVSARVGQGRARSDGLESANKHCNHTHKGRSARDARTR